MVSEWLCAKCHRKFFSSNESREKEHVTCVNCGAQVKNPYYEEILQVKTKTSKGSQPPAH